MNRRSFFSLATVAPIAAAMPSAVAGQTAPPISLEGIAGVGVPAKPIYFLELADRLTDEAYERLRQQARKEGERLGCELVILEGGIKLAQPSINITVNAFDAKSFPDNADSIAAAVRRAIQNNGPEAA